MKSFFNLGDPPVSIRWYIGLIVVAALLTLAALANWFNQKLTEQSTTVVAQVAPVVAKVETTEITPEKVVVFKPEAKKKLKLPRPVQVDDNQHVAAASTVDYSLVPKTVTTVFDEDTGQFTTYQKDQPRPWVSTRDTGSVGLAYGYRSGDMVARLSLQQNFISIKALDLGASATLDSDGEHFISIGASYRW